MAISGTVVQRALKSAELRALERAREASATALRLHLDAPRGGDTLNIFGQPRSAAQEPPAEETGMLAQRLRNGPEIEGGIARAPVNYKVLERGYAPRNLQPRPLGRITLDTIKARG